MTTDERFWSKVDFLSDPNGCWVWTAYRSAKGYGRFMHEGQVRFAHRFAYQTTVGEIPADLQIDHLCRNRACVNPSHLEPVTPRENTRRGVAGLRQRLTTHCPQGHEYDDANTYVSRRGFRNCRACLRERRRAA